MSVQMNAYSYEKKIEQLTKALPGLIQIEDTPEEEKEDKILEQLFIEHNRVRKLHVVKPLRFSNLLNDSAQEWADRLISKQSIECSPFALSEKVGELVFMKEDLKNDTDISALEVIQVWYSVVKNYNFETGEGNAGTFTQMVWNETKMVGFGKAKSGNKYVVVAHYLPPGNVRGLYTSNVKTKRSKSQKKADQKKNSNIHKKSKL